MGVLQPEPTFRTAEGEQAPSGTEQRPCPLEPMAVVRPAGRRLVVALRRLVQRPLGVGKDGTRGEEPMSVAGDAVVRLRREGLRGGALAQRHTDAHQLGDVLAQVPAATAPIADHPLYLLDQTTGGRVLSGRLGNGGGDRQRRHQQLQVVDRACSWQELPRQHAGRVHLAAPQ